MSSTDVLDRTPGRGLLSLEIAKFASLYSESSLMKVRSPPKFANHFLTVLDECGNLKLLLSKPGR